jgi:hypothetical protein
LYNLIVCVEGEAIKPHTEKILKNIVYKMILEEGNNGEKEIADKARKIAELLGLYVPCDFIVPMMVSHL